VVAEATQESLVTLLRDRPDGAEQAVGWHDRQEAEPNDRRRLEPAGREIEITRRDHFVEPGHLLPQQTRKSPYGGMARSTTAGRFLTSPDAWGNATRTTSASFIA
jgi:hypothetical protein